ncbi:RICIN domain-containing protein [Kribbella sp. NPDC058245]|uniref:RICIN domain-containing protein n=1 Tax=Kribbella sp. NPDC058245 TaxID=3346399 RepID=UPI0036EA9901
MRTVRELFMRRSLTKVVGITVLAMTGMFVAPATSSASPSSTRPNPTVDSMAYAPNPIAIPKNLKLLSREPGAPEPGKDLAFESADSRRCMDADIHTIGDGQIAQLWDCNNSQQQVWRATYYNDTDIQISSGLGSNRCLDADLNAINTNGARVQLWKCNGSLQQRWRVYVVSTDDRAIVLQNLAANRFAVLDADLHTMDRNGTKLQLWDHNGDLQQIFYSNRYK